MLDHLLNDDSEERPSFADIKEYIVKEIQFQSSKVWPSEPLCLDSEDVPA